MSTTRVTRFATASIEGLSEHRFQNAFLLMWGLTYWVALLLKPDIVANFGRAGSAASLAVLGVLILGNLLVDSDGVWIALGLFATAGVVSSWVGVTRWAVPYSAGMAGATMAIANAASAVVFFAKALEE